MDHCARPETKQQLADLNRQGVDTYLAPLIDNPGSLSHQSGEKRKRMVDAVIWQRDHMQQIPALIIACMDFGAHSDQRHDCPGATARSGRASKTCCSQLARSTSAQRLPHWR